MRRWVYLMALHSVFGAGLFSPVPGIDSLPLAFSTAGVSNHQPGWCLDEKRDFLLVFNPFDHSLSGQLPDEMLVDMNGRQGRHRESGLGNIVEPGHHNVLWYAEIVLMKPLDRADCDQIGSTHNCVRSGRQLGE